MAQFIATVAFEALPSTVALLEQAITAFRTMQEPETGPAYLDLKRNLPALHFMSIMVFRDPIYDPLFLMEVNFDGDPRSFWHALSTTAGPPIIQMLRFCAPPHDAAEARRFADLFQSGQGLPEVLAANAVHPTASHLGNRGLTRAQIEAEATLFEKTQLELNANDTDFRSKTPVAIHKSLHDRLVPAFPWLETASPPRIPQSENIADWRNLIVFASLVFSVIALPGTTLALILPWWFVAVLGIFAALALWFRVPDISRLIPSGLPEMVGLVAIVLISGVCALVWLGTTAAALFVVEAILTRLQHGAPPGFTAWISSAIRCVAAGAVGAPTSVLLILIWLRGLERRDSTSTAPAMSETLARGLAEREDKTQSVYQNHMGSVVMVKPGGLRSLLLRVGHHTLYLILRLQARDGYLSDMRTVHFAHWALLNNNSRLLFMSNFDGTWDSYLDDFIEKAHQGTTLAWTNCVGAPLAAFLALDGVTKGRQFKAWARASMAPNLFWFSAYPMLTVNQIERNHIIAEGLRQPALDAGKAALWIRWL
jgi:hypothetical protein